MGIRRDVFIKLDGFDTSMRYGEDIDFSTRIIQGGYTTRLFPEAYVYHKRRTRLIPSGRTFGGSSYCFNAEIPFNLKDRSLSASRICNRGDRPVSLGYFMPLAVPVTTALCLVAVYRCDLSIQREYLDWYAIRCSGLYSIVWLWYRLYPGLVEMEVEEISL